MFSLGPKNVRNIYAATDTIVTAAGTAVQGPDRTTTRGVVVNAPATNVGNVYIGPSTVTNVLGNERGIILVPGGMTPGVVPLENLNLLWVNADTNGDRVCYLVL